LEISLLGKCTNSSSLLWVSFCQYIYIYIIFNNVENFFPILFFFQETQNLCTKVENILEYPRFIYLFNYLIWHLDVELSLLLW
jgi:hypothetical protein